MKKDEFIARYRAEMSDVHVSPQLKRTVLDAQDGKEKPVMKKKLSAAIVLVVAISLLAAAAIAAVSRAGILDFAGRWFGVYVPKDAQNYVQTDVVAMENELAKVHVRELYYDGLVSRLVVDIVPKDPSALLLGFDNPNAALQSFNTEDGKWYGSGMPTAVDIYNEGNFHAVYAVECILNAHGAHSLGAVTNYSMNNDGSLTLYYQLEYGESSQQRDAVFSLIFTPYELPFIAESELMTNGQRTMEIPLTLQQTNAPFKAHLSTESFVFPDAGVRVDSLRLEERPLEIHAVIEYTVVDHEAFDRFEHGVWFELIDPRSTSDDPASQRLSQGLTNASSLMVLGKDRYRLTQSIGRNELHDTYTLRVYELMTHKRFGSHTFTVIPASK